VEDEEGGGEEVVIAGLIGEPLIREATMGLTGAVPGAHCAGAEDEAGCGGGRGGESSGAWGNSFGELNLVSLVSWFQ
jgi:hypothetical protein